MAISKSKLLAGAGLVLGGVVAAAAAVANTLPALTLFNTLMPKDGGVEVVRDIAYGAHERHRLDLYIPRQADPGVPVVFFAYGGAWDSGERDDYGFVGHALAARGYLTVIADYRIGPETVYPGFVEDSASAVAWVREHVGEYGGNAGNLFLAGHSAGAYNVMMTALAPRFAEIAGNEPFRGVIGLSGPYDFYPFDVAASQNAFGHYPDPEDTQPVNHVDVGPPPLLLVHGADDGTVLLRNSTRLGSLAEEAGGAVDLKVYQGAGHADTLVSIAMPLRWRYPVLEDMVAFMRANTL